MITTVPTAIPPTSETLQNHWSSSWMAQLTKIWKETTLKNIRWRGSRCTNKWWPRPSNQMRSSSRTVQRFPMGSQYTPHRTLTCTEAPTSEVSQGTVSAIGRYCQWSMDRKFTLVLSIIYSRLPSSMILYPYNQKVSRPKPTSFIHEMSWLRWCPWRVSCTLSMWSNRERISKNSAIMPRGWIQKTTELQQWCP